MLWIIYKKFLKILAKHVPIYQLRAFLFRRAGYKIGRKVFIGEDLIIIDELKDRGLISIGDRAAIAPRVTLVISSTPNFSRVSSHAPLEHGPIHIKNDAWLGTGVIVFPNITIGESAIIGAGSVVNQDIPPFCIAAGVPAKVIREIGKAGEKTKNIAAKN